MIKGIPPSDKKTARQTEADKPDASSVSRESSEQFSSLLHKKNKSELKELAKSKKKIEKSIAKVTDKLTQQIGQNQETKQQASKAQPSADKQQAGDNENLPQSLDAFDIASMIARNQAPAQSPTAPTEVAPAPTADLSQVVGEIADRILVSSAADNPNGVQEIRIHLKESVLPDTEVRIYRHGGSLQVEFMAASKDSEMFIAQRQPEIQKTLGERLSDETVTVSVQDSRQTQSGQEQGRSRQQYIRPDQDDNE